MGFLTFDDEGYKISKTIDLFKEEKDNYLFNAIFKGGKYYLSYISQYVPFMIVLDAKGELLYKLDLDKKWICAFVEYSNRFFVAAGYHSLRLVDTQATPPIKSPLIAKDYILKCGQIFNMKKTYKSNEFMLMTRDGLHFLEITRVMTAPKPKFTVSNIFKW